MVGELQIKTGGNKCGNVLYGLPFTFLRKANVAKCFSFFRVIDVPKPFNKFCRRSP